MDSLRLVASQRVRRNRKFPLVGRIYFVVTQVPPSSPLLGHKNILRGVLRVNFDWGIRTKEWAMSNVDLDGVKLSSVLNPQSSILNPRSSILILRSSLLNPKSSILGPQSPVLGPQSSLFLYFFGILRRRLSCFAPKNLIYGIFVANVAKNTTYALWG